MILFSLHETDRLGATTDFHVVLILSFSAANWSTLRSLTRRSNQTRYTKTTSRTDPPTEQIENQFLAAAAAFILLNPV